MKARGKEITAFDLAMRYVGTKEIKGSLDNPLILAILKLDNSWPTHDEVPWCSGFGNWIAWHLSIPRSKDLRARSWLRVGRVVSLDEAIVGWDVVILRRGTGPISPDDPTYYTAPGHMGWFAGRENGRVVILGGNQGDMVCTASYPEDRIEGIRRLWEAP